MKNKKAAIEMSMGTVVVIVLSVTILIFGMIFIKNIMCAGIVMTDKIDEKVTNEIQSLFGTNDYGVKCMGEDGQEITIGDGGRRVIACTIITDTQQDYDLNLYTIDSLKGTEPLQVQRWVLDQDWKGPVSPGQKTIPVAVLDIPRDISATTLKIEVKESINGVEKELHTMYIDVKHIGTVTSNLC